MASPGLSEIIITTHRNRRKTFANGVENNNPVSRSMKENGTFEMEEGGRTLVDPIMFDENGTFMRYNGGQPLNLSYNDTQTGFEVDWKQFAVAITVTGREERMNSGEFAIKKLIKQRMQVAEYTLENNFNADLIADGTADGGLQMGGLKYWITDTPTSGTKGGIDVSTGTVFQNLKYATASDTFAGSTGATTTSNVKARLNYCINKTTRGSDTVKVMLAGQTMFETIQSANDNLVRVIQEKEVARTGFTQLYHMGIPIYMCGGVNFGGQTQIAADRIYGVNTKFTKVRIHKDAYFEPLENLQSINADTRAQIIVFMGNMTCSCPALNFVLFDS